MTAANKLLIVTTADAALTPAQRRFNQLVHQIEQARGQLLDWQEQVPLFAQTFAQQVRPLMKELAGCRHMVVVKLDAMLAQGRWTKIECAAMRCIVCEVAAILIEDEAIDELVAAELKALHDKHAETDFDTGKLEAIAAMKSLFETMSGMPLGDEEFESDAAHLLQATAERAHHYNQVLAAQLRELKAEVQERELAFCMDFGFDPDARLQPHKLGKLLDQQKGELDAALAQAKHDLRRLGDPAAAKRWLKRMRQKHQAFGDECLF